jgi:hypothetical protein
VKHQGKDLCCSKHSLQTSSTGVTWELDEKAESQSPNAELNLHFNHTAKQLIGRHFESMP